VTEPATRKKHVRLYESQRLQIRHLGQLGATWPAIVELYGVSRTTAQEMLKGNLGSASTGYRDITGGKVFQQDPLQVRRVLGYGRGLRSVKEEREPYWQALLNACTANVREDELAEAGIAESEPEPPEPEAVPPGITYTNTNVNTTSSTNGGANVHWEIHSAPSQAPIYDELVRLVGQLLEPSVRSFLDGLQQVAEQAVNRAVDAYTQPQT
jgi:hypothetical protein